MLDPKLIEEVEKLLESGVSARKISKRLNISRGSISAIRNGTRKIYVRKETSDFTEPSGPLQRCPGCGAMAQMPCLSCTLRALHEKQGRFEWDARQIGPIEIELTGQHLERYHEVREWREKSDNPHYTDIPEDWPWREKNRRTAAKSFR